MLDITKRARILAESMSTLGEQGKTIFVSTALGATHEELIQILDIARNDSTYPLGDQDINSLIENRGDKAIIQQYLGMEQDTNDTINTNGLLVSGILNFKLSYFSKGGITKPSLGKVEVNVLKLKFSRPLFDSRSILKATPEDKFEVKRKIPTITIFESGFLMYSRSFLIELLGDFRVFFDDFMNSPRNFIDKSTGVEISFISIIHANGWVSEVPEFPNIYKESLEKITIRIFGEEAETYKTQLESKQEGKKLLAEVYKTQLGSKQERGKLLFDEKRKELEGKLRDTNYLRNLIGDISIFYSDFPKAPKRFFVEETQTHVTFDLIIKANGWENEFYNPIKLSIKENVHKVLEKIFGEEAEDYQQELQKRLEEEKQDSLLQWNFLKDINVLREIIGTFEPYFTSFSKAPKNFSIPSHFKTIGPRTKIDFKLIIKVNEWENKYLDVNKESILRLLVDIFGEPAEVYKTQLESKQEGEKLLFDEKRKKLEKKLCDTNYLRKLIGDFKQYFTNFTKAPRSFYVPEVGENIGFPTISKVNGWDNPGLENSKRYTKTNIYPILEKIFGEEVIKLREKTDGVKDRLDKKLQDITFLKGLIGDISIFYSDFSKAPKRIFVEETQTYVTFYRIIKANGWEDEFYNPHSSSKKNVHKVLEKIFGEECRKYKMLFENNELQLRLRGIITNISKLQQDFGYIFSVLDGDDKNNLSIGNIEDLSLNELKRILGDLDIGK